jgi:hypothetical protein
MSTLPKLKFDKSKVHMRHTSSLLENFKKIVVFTLQMIQWHGVAYPNFVKQIPSICKP